MTTVQWYFLCAAVIVIGVIIEFIRYLVNHSRVPRKFRRKKFKFVDNSSFLQMKKHISSKCTPETLKEFSDFIFRKYHGSMIIYADDFDPENPDPYKQNTVYTHRELSDLKGIFLHVIAKSKYISVIQKEEFRRGLINIGVTGIDERPNYELRDGKLKMDKSLNNDEFKRKKVGNDGEQKIRDILEPMKKKNYKIINGLKLINKGERIEIDHLVISHSGVYVFETKAFGISEDGKNQVCRLEIKKDGEWLLHKKTKKNFWYNRGISNPSDQMIRQKKFFNDLFGEMRNKRINLKCALVLANSEITVDQKEQLPFDIVKVSDLEEYLQNRDYTMSDDHIKLILMRIDNHRIN